jgi:hypothetical protein
MAIATGLPLEVAGAVEGSGGCACGSAAAGFYTMCVPEGWVGRAGHLA